MEIKQYRKGWAGAVAAGKAGILGYSAVAGSGMRKVSKNHGQDAINRGEQA
jgi:hypothetical protein